MWLRLLQPRVPETSRELACVLSHLLAIHRAVHDRALAPASPYALVIGESEAAHSLIT
jgi:hypothetical protein